MTALLYRPRRSRDTGPGRVIGELNQRVHAPEAFEYLRSVRDRLGHLGVRGADFLKRRSTGLDR